MACTLRGGREARVRSNNPFAPQVLLPAQGGSETAPWWQWHHLNHHHHHRHRRRCRRRCRRQRGVDPVHQSMDAPSKISCSRCSTTSQREVTGHPQSAPLPCHATSSRGGSTSTAERLGGQWEGAAHTQHNNTQQAHNKHRRCREGGGAGAWRYGVLPCVHPGNMKREQRLCVWECMCEAVCGHERASCATLRQ